MWYEGPKILICEECFTFLIFITKILFFFCFSIWYFSTLKLCIHTVVWYYPDLPIPRLAKEGDKIGIWAKKLEAMNFTCLILLNVHMRYSTHLQLMRPWILRLSTYIRGSRSELSTSQLAFLGSGCWLEGSVFDSRWCRLFYGLYHFPSLDYQSFSDMQTSEITNFKIIKTYSSSLSWLVHWFRNSWKVVKIEFYNDM